MVPSVLALVCVESSTFPSPYRRCVTDSQTPVRDSFSFRTSPVVVSVPVGLSTSDVAGVVCKSQEFISCRKGQLQLNFRVEPRVVIKIPKMSLNSCYEVNYFRSMRRVVLSDGEVLIQSPGLIFEQVMSLKGKTHFDKVR